jgi:paraquat-inducible protein A
VATMVSTLVQLRGLATIRVGPAAAAFGGVVVLTMMATRAFDPRLIWDVQAQLDDGEGQA